jgi:abequosyltransferase
MSRLLTIIVPTYNRANCLAMLLDALTVELQGFEDRVDIVIGDNASTDGTPAVTAAFAIRWTATRVLRHAENVGPDENFCRCVEAVETPYFWIIGDDDLPRAGALPALLTMLDTHQPDLIYLSSRWTRSLSNHEAAGRLNSLEATSMGRRDFARRVHVWTTFISGSIIKRSLAPDASLRRFAGSLLVQLGWILGALRQGQCFIHVASPCVLATSGNSGGYGVLKVFGNNFQRVTREALSSDADQRAMAEDIIRRASIAFLPDLVWGFRQAKAGNFDQKEGIIDNLEPQLGSSLAYRWIIRPLSTATPSAAALLLKIAHGATRLTAASDRLRARFVGGVKAL